MNEPRIYAYIPDSTIIEIIQPIVADGVEVDIPITERYTPDFAALCVDITDYDPRPAANWNAANNGGEWSFSPPTVYVPTPEEILASNTAYRNQCLAAAALAIAPLQDAVDLGEATSDDEAMLLKWKQFRVAVNRIVLTLPNPAWPIPPQPGYGAAFANPTS